MNHINSFTCWQIVFELQGFLRRGTGEWWKECLNTYDTPSRNIHFSSNDLVSKCIKNCKKFGLRRCDTIQSKENEQQQCRPDARAFRIQCWECRRQSTKMGFAFSSFFPFLFWANAIKWKRKKLCDADDGWRRRWERKLHSKTKI